jgi:flagellar basal-body rod modification protein FlgD
MVDSVSSVSSSTSLFEASETASEELGKEAFLKLLVAQLEFQDPLEPKENSEFVAELAQFSSLEQTVGINDRLDQLSLQTQGLANSQVTSLVGTTATVSGNMVTVDGTGSGTPVAFELGDDATSVKVSITNQNGDVIRTIDVGERSEGYVQIQWNGQSDAGIVQPEGTYVVSVVAENENGDAVDVSQETTSEVSAVSFDKGYPVLHLTNGAAVPVSDLLRVESNT